jgi:hypothetical protein
MKKNCVYEDKYFMVISEEQVVGLRKRIAEILTEPKYKKMGELAEL